MQTINFDDIDAQAACFAGYDQRYLQFGRGRFSGQFTSVELCCGTGFYIEQVNRVLLQEAAVPLGHHALGFLLDCEGSSLMNGQAFTLDHVFALRGGQGIEMRTAEAMRICVVSLGDEAPDGSDDVLDALRASHGGVILAQNAAARLRRLVAHTMQTLPLSGPDPGDARGFTRRLLGPVLSLTSRQEGRPSDARASRRLAQARLFRLARADIDARLREDFCVKDLCDRLAVSRRSLEYLFHNHAGVSPAEYVRLARLNRIRYTLLQPDGARRSIGDVAAEYGIWHLGRLSQEYGRTFGELPSQSKQLAKTPCQRVVDRNRENAN